MQAGFLHYLQLVDAVIGWRG